MQNPLNTFFHPQWLNNIGIRKKLIIFTIIPVTAMLFFAASEISDKYKSYKRNEKIYSFLIVADKLDDLVYEMQRERGVSLGLSETKSSFFKNKIEAERKLTNEALQNYLKIIEKIDSSFLSKKKYKEFIKLEKMLMQLKRTRRKVDMENFSDTNEQYSDLNSQAINLIQHLQQLTNDAKMTKMGNAYTSLLWLQERAGQERASLIWAFSSGKISANDFRNLVTFSESQKTIIKSFNYTAPKEYSHILQETLSHPINKEVASYREAAINKASRNEIINELLTLIGYGGFIHNFKNYIIRGNIADLTRINYSKKEAQKILEKLKNIPGMNQKYYSQLMFIEDTFKEYFSLTDKIKILRQQGKNTQEIDKIIKIDDTSAIQAISYLRTGLVDKNATAWWKASTKRIDLIKKAKKQIKDDMIKQSIGNIESAKQSLWAYLLTAIATLVVSIFIGTQIARRLVVEVENISHNMRRMILTDHRLDQPLLITGRDEIGIMAETFNQLMHERQKLEVELRLSAEVFSNISEAIIIADADQKIEMINPACIKVSGYTEENLLEKELLYLAKNSTDKTTKSQIWHKLFHDFHWEGEIWHKKPNGEKYLAHLNISIVKDKEGVITQYICTFTDITQRKQYEENIWYQANFDALTNLPNRKMCLDRLAENIKIANRTNKQIAVLFIDLDRFKLINDTLGHKAGDELLIEIASRLKQSVRKSDIVSRLGGDEFVIILTNIINVNNVLSTSNKILTALSDPVLLEDNSETFTSGSIGVAIYPQDGQNIDTLIKHADTAMYQSKKMGRNNTIFFKEGMNHDY